MPERMGTSFRRGEASRPGRDEPRLFVRAFRFLLMWGTPIAIGFFLGSAGGGSTRPSTASGAVHLAPPSR